MVDEPVSAERAVVTDIQRFSLHDGPGIRTLVFLKGCPLSCRWCQNPETQDRQLQIGFNASSCDESWCCREACPEEAIIEGPWRIKTSRCTACGACVDACPTNALRRIGRHMTRAELLREILRDRAYYGDGEGGVTFSGGEPTLHPEFLGPLVAVCREEGIHVAIETAGLFHRATWLPILAGVDLIYFDLKHMDDLRHRELTGVSNQRILANARFLRHQRFPVVFRMPLVEGLNDDEANLAATARLLHDLGQPELVLLPYHNMGEAKIDLIRGHQPKLGLPMYPPERLATVRSTMGGLGITCLEP